MQSQPADVLLVCCKVRNYVLLAQPCENACGRTAPWFNFLLLCRAFRCLLCYLTERCLVSFPLVSVPWRWKWNKFVLTEPQIYRLVTFHKSLLHFWNKMNNKKRFILITELYKTDLHIFKQIRINFCIYFLKQLHLPEESLTISCMTLMKVLFNNLIRQLCLKSLCLWCLCD